MNGTAITISTVSDHPYSETLDDEWEAWSNRYNEKPSDDNHGAIWNDDAKQEASDRDGAGLARKDHDFFGGRRTVIYCPTVGEEIHLAAIGKPPIRCTG